MHKSIITITGLFFLLIGSFVILSAIPILNNHSFTKTAMAQEYEGYNYDPNKIMDNSYGMHYNYPEQEHASYNDGYNDKRTSDNYKDNVDSYGNDDYSKYASKDKQYECRTGPFEGLFVSSVEFCLSDRKSLDDNQSPFLKTLNCINNNDININEDNNESPSVGSQQIQDAVAAQEGIGNTLDGVSPIDLDKSVINLCVINDNDNIVIGGDGTTSDSEPCKTCFVSQNIGGSVPQEYLNRLNNILPTALVDLGNNMDERILNIQALCNAIEREFEEGTLVTDDQLRAIFPQGGGGGIEGEGIINCLIVLGLISSTP